MKRFRKIASLLLAMCMLMTASVYGCQASEGEEGSKWLKLAQSFVYPSLDAHKDYYGWYTSIYGITETLFRVADDLTVKPLLASEYEVSEDGKTWTIHMADATFSNGTPVTADMIVRNLELLAEVNECFAYLDGTVSAAVGPFTTAAPYGQVTKPAPDPEVVKEVLEAAGYVLGDNGMYEKDGEPLQIFNR